jgi:hypothetical protein
MAPDCLEKMVAALKAHPECDLAHCNLKIIGQSGEETDDWWTKTSLFFLSSKELIEREHIRKAPFDGLLHLCGQNVYISITQLLIRRSLFDRIGLFDGRWGSVGDFNWCMRAALVANTVHVPGTWGGWRVHPAQATAAANLLSAEHGRKVEEMISDAIARAAQDPSPPVPAAMLQAWARESEDLRQFSRDLQLSSSPIKRKALILSSLARGSRAAWDHSRARWRGSQRWHESAHEMVRDWLDKAGVGPVLIPCVSSR